MKVNFLLVVSARYDPYSIVSILRLLSCCDWPSLLGKTRPPANVGIAIHAVPSWSALRNTAHVMTDIQVATLLCLAGPIHTTPTTYHDNNSNKKTRNPGIVSCTIMCRVGLTNAQDWHFRLWRIPQFPNNVTHQEEVINLKRDINNPALSTRKVTEWTKFATNSQKTAYFIMLVRASYIFVSLLYLNTN